MNALLTTTYILYLGYIQIENNENKIIVIDFHPTASLNS